MKVGNQNCNSVHKISQQLLIFIYFYYDTVLSQENLKDDMDFCLTFFKFHSQTQNRKILLVSDVIYADTVIQLYICVKRESVLCSPSYSKCTQCICQYIWFAHDYFGQITTAGNLAHDTPNLLITFSLKIKPFPFVNLDNKK